MRRGDTEITWILDDEGDSEGDAAAGEGARCKTRTEVRRSLDENIKSNVQTDTTEPTSASPTTICLTRLNFFRSMRAMFRWCAHSR